VGDNACCACGFCCKQGPCSFGSWDESSHQCAYLMGHGPGYYACAIADNIRSRPLSNMSPAFGAGCCSAMNSDRRFVITKLVRR
jgi:hypothetical protein